MFSIYFFVLVEFKHTEFFTFYGDCFLTTKLYVPSVAFLIAGLDQTKFGFYQLQSFLFIVVIVISILLKTTFLQISIHSQLAITAENFIVIGQGENHF